jgi:hypothetical protein
MPHLTEQLGRIPIVPLIFVAAALLLLALISRGEGAPTPVSKPFMTKREQAMLFALEEILPMYRIHAQVSMGALLAAPHRPGRRPNPGDRNAFSQKIVDFVVVDPTVGKVIALIELDDRSHDATKDRKRDTMTARAGYRTIRIPASARPTIPTALAAVGHLRVASLVDAVASS